ncbi:MAG: hypothetical protein ACK5LT_13230 [Lachnospirales bacterium]
MGVLLDNKKRKMFIYILISLVGLITYGIVGGLIGIVVLKFWKYIFSNMKDKKTCLYIGCAMLVIMVPYITYTIKSSSGLAQEDFFGSIYLFYILYVLTMVAMFINVLRFKVN